MGYCIDVEINKVIIPSDKIADCLKAVNDLTIGKNHSWVHAPESPFTDLKEALAEWRYEGHTNKDGDLELFYFTGEKLGDDEELFQTIAPYIKDGGNVQYRGEDGFMWRYTFTNGEFEEQSAKISWE